MAPAKKTASAKTVADAKTAVKAASKTAAPAGTKAKAKPAATAKPKATSADKVTKTAAKATKPKAKAKTTTTAAVKTKTTTTTAAAKTKTKAKMDESMINGDKKPAARKARAPAVAKDTKAAASKPAASKKRKAETSEQEDTPKKAKKPKVVKKDAIINHAPTKRLHIYAFGEGANGELGLGTKNKDKDVKRPRLNPNLDASTIGVVQLIAGGMHSVALTHDNKILTWGVNDQGALGRDTTWNGGTRDVDDEDSDDEDSPNGESGMNPKETMPTALSSDCFPPDTIFTHVAAGDSCSFAVTDDGHVWGWGTFRSDDGVLGFSSTSHIQAVPALIPTLRKIKTVICGANHALALDTAGSVFAWGNGQQAQIGRKILERHRLAGLTPGEFGLPKRAIKQIATGQHHAFAIDNKDRVWSWGLNNFGQTGIVEGAGEDGAFVSTPAVVESLSHKGTKSIVGGGLHSLAVDANGDCLTWGRIDNDQLGVNAADIDEEATILGSNGKPKILTAPTRVRAVPGPIAQASLGPDHCIVVNEAGKAYSWGFSINYQTGLGTSDDVKEPTLIDNTAVREKKLYGAYAGGQFGMLSASA